MIDCFFRSSGRMQSAKLNMQRVLHTMSDVQPQIKSVATPSGVTKRYCMMHTGEKLRPIKISADRISSYVAMFGEFYTCKVCDAHKTMLHVYCYLCDRIFLAKYSYYPNCGGHYSIYHEFVAEKCLYKCSDYIDMDSVLVYNAVNRKLSTAPQYSVVIPSDNNPTQEIVDFVRDYLSGIAYVFSVDSGAIMDDMVAECLALKSYSCVFCGEDYDAMPPFEIAFMHIRSCVAI